MTSGENMWAATYGDFSKLQGDLNFAFDQRESKVCTCLLKSIVSVVKYFENDFLG
jgi:hypothetical protein